MRKLQSRTPRRVVPAASGSTAVIAISCRATLMARVGVIAMEDVISDTGAVGRGDQSRGAHPQHARLAVAAEVILVALDGVAP
jgi:hypothetical protein